jgi:hypothetical protein
VSRLRALVGLEAPQAGRDENFTAWLRFVEQVALAKPLVLVLEDLHWADEGLLAFVEHLATHADAVPLLVIGTARPELFEQQPTFAAGSTHIDRISLDPLTREETERLVAGLVGGSEAWGQKVADIVDHCEGNPFFAEESAHLLADHVQTTKVPASVQAVVAARLDALPPVQKAVFGDAAVVGGVFWSGVVMALGRRQPAEVDAALRDLVGKQLVRRVRDSTMSGENEFAFAHALARDVAYGQLPRAVRAAKHAEVAAWLEAQFGDGLEDVSEVLAHHYVAGLELAEAVGKDELVEQLRRRAIEALHMAGKRALSLDAASAGRYLSRALDLAGPAGAERPRLLYLQAQALASRGQWREEIACMEEAIPAARASGDVRLAGLAMKQLAGARDIVGDAGGLELVDEAVTMLETDGASSELVELLAMQSGYALWAAQRADPRLALRLGERAAAVSHELGIPPSPEALGYHASALGYIGASGWEDEFARAIELAKDMGLSQPVSLLLFNRSVCIASQTGPREALAALDEYRELADRVGAEAWQTDYRGAAAEANALLGRWDDALSDAHEIRIRASGQDDLWMYLDAGSLEVLIMSFRGQTRGLRELAEAIETAAKDCVMVVQQAYRLLSSAVAHGALGRREVALGLAREWCSLGYRAYGDARSTLLFPQTMRGCASGGDIDLVRQLAATLEPAPTCNRLVIGIAEALVSEGSGDFSAAAAGFAAAAAGWQDFGVPYEEAQALLGQGRCLVALGRAPEAAAPLAAAREIFTRLGAKPALAETDAMLAQLGAAGTS